MTSTPLRRAFLALHVSLGLVIAYESARGLMHALSHTEHSHLAVVAALEGVAALLFLWPRTLRVGGMALLVILVAALVVHAFRGEFPAPLLVYAAGVLYVTLHGDGWRSIEG